MSSLTRLSPWSITVSMHRTTLFSASSSFCQNFRESPLKRWMMTSLAFRTRLLSCRFQGSPSPVHPFFGSSLSRMWCGASGKRFFNSV